jgi:hypothetical protein
MRTETDTDTSGDDMDLVIPGAVGGEAGMSVEAYRYGEAGNASQE